MEKMRIIYCIKRRFKLIHTLEQFYICIFRELSNISSWDEKVLHNIVDEFLNLRFPMLLVLNKADRDGAHSHIER